MLQNKLFWIIGGIILLGIVFFVGRCSTPEKLVRVISDPTIEQRLDTMNIHDTTVTFIESFIVKESTPDTIREMKVDTLFIEKTDNQYLALKFSRDGDTLRVWAVNRNAMKLAELTFTGVGRDFTATSTAEGVFVKSKKFYLNPLGIYGAYDLPIKKDMKLKDGSPEIGLKQRLSYMDAVELNLKQYYKIDTKDLGVEADLTLWF